ncbi:hypothetical protein C882_4015 [Caenispirillum salinarum AK4]|uniref:Uncharacterized protein n=1 Tax=Caenispirillum salinarum AK4 TaxID=1238182 RepID=K9H277_9PROT|nr:hypothetical protein [Caenispirillum salinarum]EKV31642.1 hypothetical protein C882_4015 [Caenispirillum salinarum AK4]
MPTTITELPNPLFSNGRSVLARFGYRHLEDGELREDWAEMWELLRPDFAERADRHVPAYGDLSPVQAAAAREYMSVRLIADRNLEICERRHVQLFSGGIQTDGVERYAEARDAYEEAVETFGHAREALDALLSRAAA